MDPSRATVKLHMKRAFPNFALPLFSVLGIVAFGCGPSQASDLQVERLPEVTPNLPSVPQIPPPPHPTTYPDGAYSVYGSRARLRNTIDTEIAVTGYIVDIYLPPEGCDENPTCRPAAPHMWVADTQIANPSEREERAKQLMVVGYAENQTQIDEAVELAERGRYEPPDPESGLLPIPTDFAVGNKIKVNGRFTRVSGSGFNSSDGLLDYRGHETLEAVEQEE